jgi:enamine deaminase RidA (YjgF/YER057c/UK114 family)
LKALDNLETVLSAAGLKLENVVRLNYYTTDVNAVLAAAPQFGKTLQDAKCQPPATL